MIVEKITFFLKKKTAHHKIARGRSFLSNFVLFSLSQEVLTKALIRVMLGKDMSQMIPQFNQKNML